MPRKEVKTPISEKTMSIPFSSALTKLTDCNPAFDKGILRVAYTGRNRNNSFISKETYERCMESIYNCPIVCNYIREEDEIGGHDVELVHTENGMKLVHITQPVGVIPESAAYWWEEIEDDTGIHEYLCVDALLWKRQEAYQKIKADGITDESMEIHVRDGQMTDGVYVIREFAFLAFCLLGRDSPCFESASLQLFSAGDFAEQYHRMLQELHMTHGETRAGLKPADRAPEKESAEGGNDNLTEEKKTEDQNESFALMAEQLREELVCRLSAETLETEYGQIARYHYVDYEVAAQMVYAYDAKDWLLYGFGFTMSGEAPVVGFASKKRMKFTIAPFDSGDAPQSMEALFHAVAASAAGKASAALEAEQMKFAKEKGALDAELESLRAFRQEALAKERTEMEAGVFAAFADLAGNEAFEALRQDCGELTREELEDRCFALRGRYGHLQFSTPNAGKPKAPKLPVEQKTEPEPYGGLFSLYGAVND